MNPGRKKMNGCVALLSCVVAAMVSSCAFTSEDPGEMNPYRLAAEGAYREARAEGASYEEAHRRSLFAGGSWRDQEALRSKGLIDRGNR